MTQWNSTLALGGLILLLGCGVSVDVDTVGTDDRSGGSPSTELRSLRGTSIVCYNVENLFDTTDDMDSQDRDFLPNGRLNWTEERYQQKLAHIAEAIRWCGEVMPPVIGLVEVENRRVLDDLLRTGPFKASAYTVVHYDSPDERGIDVALLVNDAYASVRKSEVLDVQLDRGDRTREVLYAQLGTASDEELNVMVVHWPSRREGVLESEPKRMAAAAVVRHKVDILLEQDPTARILVMGDMNDAPRDRSIQEGLVAACSRNAKADLFDLMCIDQVQGHGSHNYHGEWAYLDQMIVSRAFLDEVEKAYALWDERLLFDHPRYGPSPDKTYTGTKYIGGYSDHLPVVLKLR